jgi:hypothetical protein
VGEGRDPQPAALLGDVDVDRLIDTAETIDGLPFVRLADVRAYTELAGRPRTGSTCAGSTRGGPTPADRCAPLRGGRGR